MKVFVCFRFCLNKDGLLLSNFFFPNVFNLGVRISKILFFIDVVSVYPLVDVRPCLASFTKLRRPSVQIFLVVLNMLSQYELLWRKVDIEQILQGV